jgi:hypothetical protein
VIVVAAITTASCARLVRDPDPTERAVAAAREVRAEQSGQRATARGKAGDIYRREAEKAEAEGDFLRAYAIHKHHIRNSKETAKAREKLIQWAFDYAESFLKNDPMRAMRILTELMQTRELAPPKSRAQPHLAKAANRAWTAVETLAARRHYVPAVDVAAGIVKLTGKDGPWARGLARIRREARQFHEKEAKRLARYPWARYFHLTMASHFGDRSPRTPMPNTVTGTGRWPCDTISRVVASKTRTKGIGLRVNLNLASCDKVERTEERMGTVEYTEQVPVYRDEYTFREVKTTGFTPWMGQTTSPCIRSDNGVCTAWARVEAKKPRSSPKVSHIEVRSKRVIDHYKTVKRTRPGKVRYTIGEFVAKGTVSVEVASKTRRFPVLVRARDRRTLDDRLVATVESFVEQAISPQLSALASRRNTAPGHDARLDAEVALVIASQDDERARHIKKLFGTKRWRWGPRPGGAFAIWGRPTVVVPKVEGAEQYENAAKSAFINSSDWGLAHRGLHQVGFKEGIGEDEYYPVKGLAVTALLGSSPLIDTDLMSQVELRLLRRGVLDAVVWVGASALVGDASTIGAAAQLRLPYDASVWRFGLHGIWQRGAEPEDPSRSRPTLLNIGPSTSYDIRIKSSFLRPYVRLNLLQVSGSGGPYGLTKPTEIGTRFRFHLWRAWWLEASGAGYLGAENTWVWSLGVSFDDTSPMPVDPDVIRERL